MEKFKIGITLGIIILVILALGLFGSYEAAKIGTDCDVGIGRDGSVFCWKWHQNILGKIGDELDQAING